MRSHFKTLLVALDFREASSALCNEAVLIAKVSNANVTLIHVIEDFPYYPYYPIDSEKMYEDQYHVIKEKLEKIKEEFTEEGINVNESIVARGKKAYRTICESANGIEDCGIIIGVGDHYLLGKLIGSTADKVVRMAKQIIILVNHNCHKGMFKKILCGYDFSKISDKALVAAIQMTKLFNAHLDIVHVIDEHTFFTVPTVTGTVATHADNQDEMGKARDRVSIMIVKALGVQNLDGVSHTVHILKGEPTIELTRMVEELDSDLLVIGPCGHSTFEKFFLGSTTEKLIRKMPCSILITKQALT